MEQMFDLERFISAHRRDYHRALAEVRGGRKATHWMWYIFPQLQGLGTSPTSQRYAIRNLDEARAFADDSYLGGNLREISQVLLSLDVCDPRAVFGRPDDMKLRSSMTLFACACKDEAVFSAVLDAYFEGRRDCRTLRLLGIDSV